MRFIRHLEVNNYRSVKHTELVDLRDLNVIIGPNNCGKTSLLKAIDLLSNVSLEGSPFYTCKICASAASKIGNVPNMICTVNERDKYLTTERVKATFGYERNGIQSLVPGLAENESRISTSSAFDDGMKKHLKEECEKEQITLTERGQRTLQAEHISPAIWSEVKSAILDHILFSPDERLQSYKNKTIIEHINSKNLPATEQSRLVEYLREFVDPNLANIRQDLGLIRKLEGTDFDTPIAEQGSGVKSLICLMSDIISEIETRIILIDEPELGLSPAGKHELLRFLLKQCESKQIFLTTHDPTFVNPILWNRESASVYLYSLIDHDFVRVNLEKSKQDPNSFAGFLPHTTSLKQVHIYVEGTSDVYTFQIFLSKYLKKFSKWFQILNKIGIFHLAGDFWSHLLYTIPKGPYISIVVLDGDKEKSARKIVEEYSQIEMNRFEFLGNLEQLSKIRRSRASDASSPCPIYCLQRSRLEDYLKPKPRRKSGCPRVAYEMKDIPKEIVWLFDIILRWTGMKIKKPHSFKLGESHFK